MYNYLMVSFHNNVDNLNDSNHCRINHAHSCVSYSEYGLTCEWIRFLINFSIKKKTIKKAYFQFSRKYDKRRLEIIWYSYFIRLKVVTMTCSTLNQD